MQSRRLIWEPKKGILRTIPVKDLSHATIYIMVVTLSGRLALAILVVVMKMEALIQKNMLRVL